MEGLVMRKFIAVALVALAAPGTAFASGKGGGGGGGGTKPPLPLPAIAPGTFEGIGRGPLYTRESLGHAQRPRYDQKGAIIDVADKPEINGLRAEFPNNQPASWVSARPASGTAA